MRNKSVKEYTRFVAERIGLNLKEYEVQNIMFSWGLRENHEFQE